MGREEIDAFSMARWLFHSVYVIPGVRLKDGSGADCRLETATLFSGGEVSMTTVTDDPRQPFKAFINMQAAEHDGRRGSWYRDVPLGDFLPPVPGESYSLAAPLDRVTGEGFRFASMPTVGGKPQNGLHGYFWTPVDDLAVEPRAEKHVLLAEWVRKTLYPYKINPVEYKACTATSPCEETQNVELVCRSHREATDPAAPDKPAFKRVRFVGVKVGVFDCKDDSEDSCSLQTF
jgi:hypothetical protein